MTNSSSVPPADDIDLGSLGAALWRAKGRIIAVALLAGAITFIALSMMRPLYTSEARILVQNEETAFTRPTGEQGTANYRTVLDEQAVQSQVQVLTSRDLILKVVRDLKLTENAEFARDAGGSPVDRLLKAIGLRGASRESQEERAANAVAEHLNVYQLSNSSVIAIEYTSGDPQLAAQIANKLADVYINWQRDAKIEQTKDATAWLDAQIKALRKATAESEEAVESYKASEGLYAGSNNVTLNAQQLSELNSQLILAEAQESEAQARAKLIKEMLAARGDIDATPEVLNSQLVINLIEQRVLVQRQLAELSATLLPSHPRIQQLRSELADVRAQIRTEAQKVVKSLENQAQIAAAREMSLRASLNAAKSRSAGQSDAEVKLRALEREAKANRDLLESYLARYRDASARHDIGAVPAQAAIVSRAHASVLPSFPRRGPITLLVTAAALLLAIGTVLAKTIIVSDAPQRRRSPSDSYVPEELVSSEPEYMSRAEMLALSQMATARSSEPRSTLAGPRAQPVIDNRPPSDKRPKRKLRKRPTAAPHGPQTAPAPATAPERHSEAPEQAKPGAERAETTRHEGSEGRATTAVAPAPKKTMPATTTAPVHRPKPAEERAPDVKDKPATTEQPAHAAPSDGRRKSVWRATKPAKRPSWLAVSEPRSSTLDAPAAPESAPASEEASSRSEEPTQPKPQTAETAKPKPAAEAEHPSPTKSASSAEATQQVSEKAPKMEAPEMEAPQEQAPDREPTQEAGTDKAGALAALAATAVARAAKAVSAEPKPAARPDEDVAAKTPERPTAPKTEQADREADSAGAGTDNTGPASTMDFIQRIRQDVIKQGEAERAAAETKRGSGRLLDRLRGKSTKARTSQEPNDATPTATTSDDAKQQHLDDESEMAALSPNDLRHYLTQRIATSDVPDEWEQAADLEMDTAEIGPVMGSLDEVIETVLEGSTGGLPRAILVAGLSSRAQSPQAAIGIARELASQNEQVALVDLAKGAAVVSGRLNMPRVPGFADLAAGAVDFADVVNLDDGSTLQVIPAGNPALNDSYDAPDKFMRVFEALTQTYDCVVLHADMAAIESLMPALKFELPVAVAVLPPRATPNDEREQLSTVRRLGCPVVLYGTATKNKQRRFSLFGRKVAV